MPIPNSILNDNLPLGVDPALNLFESLATLRVPTTTESTTGQQIHTFVDSTTYVNIPCRKAPLILVRPQEQEVSRPGVQTTAAKFQVNLIRMIPLEPEVLVMYQVKVDGQIYQILSVEPDGSGLTTRLLVSDPVAYVE